ncbi:MAG: alpha-glucan family phosphorylase [Candidatus Nanoarchaeia archaeon]
MERFFFKTPEVRRVAYFSMEIGLISDMPTYSGGLGILAGDTIKAAADLSVPMVALTLVHEKGYFSQKLNEKGEQTEIPSSWRKEDFLEPLDAEIIVMIEGREVRVKCWRRIYKGVKGYEVPLLFLDTNVPGNSEYDRTLTSHLYGGDNKYRFCQEIVLGIGGMRMLRALGYNEIRKFHMNEGHACLLTLELLKENYYHDVEDIKKKCVFTTHTPVPAGHDKFDPDMIRQLMPDFPFNVPELYDAERKINMTLLGLHFSNYVNGVAKKHGEVSREMFPNYPIHSITNGVHSETWTCDAFKDLFDKHIPEWRHDSFNLRYVAGVSAKEINEAHQRAKKALIDEINKKSPSKFDYDTFTIGFARRATAYKRPDLLFTDINRLKNIAKKGKLQLVFAGKAHARDFEGKEIIKQIFSLRDKLGENIKLVYMENYDMELAKKIVSGVDIWLNTPMRPREASGTSGMKAAHNGVPNFSVLDGWWIEGCIENITGWSIGDMDPVMAEKPQDDEDSNSLYDKLENVILPTYYFEKEKFMEIMKAQIVINASFFNTHRMVSQYVLKAYFH